MRKRTKVVPVDGCPGLVEAGVREVEIRSLNYSKVDKSQVEALSYTRETYGDQYEELQKQVDKARAAGKTGDDDDGPKTLIQKLRIKGFHPPALVRFGLVSIDGEVVPTEDKARREFVDDELDREAVEWIACQIGLYNRLIEEEPTPEEAEKND